MNKCPEVIKNIESCIHEAKNKSKIFNDKNPNYLSTILLKKYYKDCELKYYHLCFEHCKQHPNYFF